MLLKRIFRFARPHLLFLVLGIFFALTGVLAALVPPEHAKRIVDDIMIPASGGNAENLSGLLINLLLILAAVIIMRAAGIYFRTISLEIFSQRTVKDLKQKLYDHIQSMSFNFFHENRSGELMARMTGDLEAVRDMLSQGLIKLMIMIVKVIISHKAFLGKKFLKFKKHDYLYLSLFVKTLKKGLLFKGVISFLEKCRFLYKFPD